MPVATFSKLRAAYAILLEGQAVLEEPLHKRRVTLALQRLVAPSRQARNGQEEIVPHGIWNP